MAIIQFENGVRVKFNGNPTPQDVEEVARQLGIDGKPPQLAPEAPQIRREAATFPATGRETPSGAAARAVGNIPSSAFDFGKNLIQFFNPLNTIKTVSALGTALGEARAEGLTVRQIAAETALGLPTAAYQLLVPQFLKHVLDGDLEKASATVQNDPIGQVAPLVLVARGVAHASGRGAVFDRAVSTLAKPVTMPTRALGRGVGGFATQILGATTGKGAGTIRVAAEGTPAFREAMRGRVTPEDVVTTAERVFENIKRTRGEEYAQDLVRLGENTKTHDISPVTRALSTQLQRFGVQQTKDGSLDFSRSSVANSGTARADIQGMYNTLKTWGSRAGDRTGIGLDLLKKQLNDFYSPSSSARAFVQSIKSKVVNILEREVTGYKEMTSKYARASELLDDVRSATGIGTKAKADVIFTKLTTAMKADKEFRLDILRQMEAAGEPFLLDKIAGINMQSFVPSGLIGRGVDVGAAWMLLTNTFNPKLLPLILSTSPRLVGEFLRLVGISGRSLKILVDALNVVARKIPSSAALVTPQASREQARKSGRPSGRSVGPLPLP